MSTKEQAIRSKLDVAALQRQILTERVLAEIKNTGHSTEFDGVFSELDTLLLEGPIKDIKDSRFNRVAQLSEILDIAFGSNVEYVGEAWTAARA